MYDSHTHMTTYYWRDENGNIHKDKPVSRYFHTKETISDHLLAAKFKLLSVQQYNEQLYLDFSRKLVGNVIEVTAIK